MERPMTTTNATLGELITLFYEEYLTIYGDEELASVAAAATINDLLNESSVDPGMAEADAA